MVTDFIGRAEYSAHLPQSNGQNQHRNAELFIKC